MEIFSRFANLKDEITYNKNDINGKAFNLTTNAKQSNVTATHDPYEVEVVEVLRNSLR